MLDLAEIAGLFGAAFLSATIFPFQSEAVLVALILTERHAVWLLVAAASLGNVLGSLANWGLGRFLLRLSNRPWFPMSGDRLTKATAWYQRYGRWSLLLSWAPVIGDPLTLAAGILREKFAVFLILVVIAKTGRYLAVAALTLGWM